LDHRTHENAGSPDVRLRGERTDAAVKCRPTDVTGSVTFTADTATSLGIAPVHGGTAQIDLPTATLGAGQHHLYATYNGDARHHRVRSAPVSVTITATPRMRYRWPELTTADKCCCAGRPCPPGQHGPARSSALFAVGLGLVGLGGICATIGRRQRAH
jgi:hypothetical protein